MLTIIHVLYLLIKVTIIFSNFDVHLILECKFSPFFTCNKCLQRKNFVVPKFSKFVQVTLCIFSLSLDK